MSQEEKAAAILVIEDDQSIRFALLEILEGEGYSVFGVENGQAGFDYLAEASELPQLILLDIMMPVMDGWGFRTRQQQSAFKTIPVAIITADGNGAQKAVKMNVQGWVAKPIVIDDLLKTIQKLLSGEKKK